MAGMEEQVVAGLLKVALALLRGGVVERLDALDAEGFDDGAHVEIIALVGQTIVFCGLSTLGKERQVDRPRKTMVCPTRLS
jgi:hypothetical protein